jgi:hypothetical protein
MKSVKAWAVLDTGGLQESGSKAHCRYSIFRTKKLAQAVAGVATGSWYVVPCEIIFKVKK